MRLIPLIIALAISIPIVAKQKDFVILSGKPVTISYPINARPVLSTAIDMLNKDLLNVFGDSLVIKDDKPEVKVEVDTSKVKLPQGFCMEVLKDGTLSIIGHDSHGAAYGILELSRLIGVSPWEWWADVIPEKRESFNLNAGYKISQAPSVEYRGIFINDEDWGLMQWSSLHFEPWYKPGRIGPKTNEKIFELLLRLRANTYWPAMHECTVPFFLTDGNREMAEKYGIYIGSSHCEPMACNAAGEWLRRGKGDYDYVNNSGAVYDFWEKRVKEVAGQEILYTLGMRGVHDGAMNGAKTIAEQKEVLQRVIADQRSLIKKYVSDSVESVPQVFIPYKEVLDIYNAGLEVPDEVTLMWCDDNYGYIRHFPTEKENSRKGGNGIYYHVSYWGRPHDYLWLGTFSPALLQQQMTEAYDRGIRKMWILNVGDIKPAEYQIELFMDMAWNIDGVRNLGVNAHLGNFLIREFGEEASSQLVPAMNEHYRLAYIRKPEFMGNTREEEYGNNSWRIVKDMPWSDEYYSKRINDYDKISDIVESLYNTIPENRKDSYFQLVKYPVQAASQMNKKMYYAQQARHGVNSWSRSDAAYDSIVSLTRIYNTGIHNNGKWHRIMDHQPRRLPVFEPVDRYDDGTTVPIVTKKPILIFNASEGNGNGNICESLGYEGCAVSLNREGTLSFNLPELGVDSVIVEFHLLPNHPVNNEDIAFSARLDEKSTQPISYKTVGRNEEWKLNVLRNQAIKSVKFPVEKKNMHELSFKAETDGVVLDQIFIYPK